MTKDETEFCNGVMSWIEQYQESVAKGPVKFGVISRRWATAAKRFHRPLLSLLQEDSRFTVEMVGKNGGMIVSKTRMKSDEELGFDHEAKIVYETIKAEGGDFKRLNEYWERLFPGSPHNPGAPDVVDNPFLD